MASLEVLLGVAAAVVLLGVLAVRVSVRLGLPSLLLYLGIGILLGESVLGIRFSDAGLTEAAGLGALVLILAEGGITTRWATVRPSLWVGIALSTVAVVVSIAVVGTAVHVALGLDWRTAFLWGAVLSSTDAAAVFSVLAYSGGMLAHASGLLATYIAALVLGNSNLPHRGDVLSFVEGTGWLAQIGLFVILGLYASPSRLVDAVVPALIAGVVLVVAARPLSVVAAAAPVKVPWREQAFLSWSGLRGAVPIVLALVALQEGAPNAQPLVDAVFVLVVVLTLLQGTTLPFVARRLGVVASEPREIEVDAAPLDELGADLLQVRVPAGSRLRGVYLRELRLPRGRTADLVLRAEEAFTPSGDTRPRVGDQFLVVTTAP